MIENLNKRIGERIKKIREIFNEGSKLSATQFAYLLGESRDKIANYENGRTPISPQILYELYNRGISPTYLITGKGNIFAENPAGEKFKKSLAGRSNIHSSLEFISQINKEIYKDDGIKIYKAAAGDLSKNLNNE